MARRMMTMGAVLAASALAAPLAAQSVEEDVRCLLSANVFARNEKDPTKQRIAQSASVFYLGRLDARISTVQLKSAIMTQAKAMQTSALGPTMTGCAKRMVEKGVALQALNVAPGAPPSPAKPK